MSELTLKGVQAGSQIGCVREDTKPALPTTPRLVDSRSDTNMIEAMPCVVICVRNAPSDEHNGGNGKG